MASSTCIDDVHALFEKAGGQLACTRAGSCSAQSGPASSGGAVTVLGLAALIARRRRRARSASIA